MTKLLNSIMNDVAHGDCIEVMRAMPWASVDFILTDPPYVTRYAPHKNNAGQTVINDDNGAWLRPAFRQMYRVLRPDSLCVSFYGWAHIDLFSAAWKEAGFRIAGHIAFRKSYASKSGFLLSHHETAYLLAKGRPQPPSAPVPNVLDFPYTGNRLHPTEKPVQPLKQLIASFTRPGHVVLDPFCGSGSTLAAARELERRFHWHRTRPCPLPHRPKPYPPAGAPRRSVLTRRAPSTIHARPAAPLIVMRKTSRFCRQFSFRIFLPLVRACPTHGFCSGGARCQGSR